MSGKLFQDKRLEWQPSSQPAECCANAPVDVSWNTFMAQGTGPVCSRSRRFNCQRRASTLGDILKHSSAYIVLVLQEMVGGLNKAQIKAILEPSSKNPQKKSAIPSEFEQSWKIKIDLSGNELHGAKATQLAKSLDPRGVRERALQLEMRSRFGV